MYRQTSLISSVQDHPAESRYNLCVQFLSFWIYKDLIEESMEIRQDELMNYTLNMSGEFHHGRLPR